MSASRELGTGASPFRAASAAAGRALTRVWLFAALLLAWWFWSAGSKSLYFPPLSSILKALWTQWVTGPARAELSSSLEHLLVGYVIASVVGIGIGALLWWWYLRAGLRESARVPEGSGWWPRHQNGRRVSPAQALRNWRGTGTPQPEGPAARSGQSEAA